MQSQTLHDPVRDDRFKDLMQKAGLPKWRDSSIRDVLNLKRLNGGLHLLIALSIWTPWQVQFLWVWNPLVPFITEADKRIHTIQSIENAVLSPREKEILRWIKEGKGSWEISVILNCSKRVVDFHVTNMKRKLNVTNRPQLVASALSRRFIAFWNPVGINTICRYSADSWFSALNIPSFGSGKFPLI